LVPREQQAQALALAGPDWLQHPDCRAPAILLGDFNATASSAVYRTLTQDLQAARRLAPRRQPTSTFPSAFPVLRIDHLFVTPGITVRDVSAPYDPLTRAASDHLPLVMDFDLS
jgi:endonuclease/exonuclease/phosphatase family metal-dependent hydrolase